MRPLWPPKTPTGAASVPSHCSPITNAASDLRESREGNERQSNLCAKRCCVGDGGTGWGKVIYDRILGGMWVQRSKRAETLAIKRPKSRKRHSAEVGMSRELHWEVTCSFPALFTFTWDNVQGRRSSHVLEAANRCKMLSVLQQGCLESRSLADGCSGNGPIRYCLHT